MAGKSLMRVLPVIACVLALGLSGCAVDALNTEPEVRGLKGSGVQNLGDPGAVADITIRVGQGVRIALKANATTGYSWSVKPGWSESIVELTTDEYRADPSPPGMTGRGGTQYYVFTGAQPGETQIMLGYARSWEDVAPVEERLLNFAILP
jgi:inhibitor of cysteine peptidase